MIAALLGCAVEISGAVTDEAGAPVGGAVLDAPSCDAVSTSDGTFRARCPRDVHAFAVSRPGYLDVATTLDASGVRGPAPITVSMVQLPTTPGVYAAREGAIPPVPTAAIRVTATDTQQRFCVEVSKATDLAEAKIFHVQDVELRAFVADADGCFYTLSRADSAYWSWAATSARSTPSELTPGRRWLQLDDAGAVVVLAEWHDGFFVMADADAGTYAGWAVRVPR